MCFKSPYFRKSQWRLRMDQIFTKVIGGGIVANFSLMKLRCWVGVHKYVTMERKTWGSVFPITSWQALSTSLPNSTSKYWTRSSTLCSSVWLERIVPVWTITQKFGGGGEPEWAPHYNGNVLHTCVYACLFLKQSPTTGGTWMHWNITWRLN